MSQDWGNALVSASWQGALLVGFVWLALAGFKNLSGASRAWLWLLAVSRFLLVPLFVIELPVLNSREIAAADSAAFESSVVYGYGTVDAAGIDWSKVVFSVWLIGVAAIVLRFVVEHFRLVRIAREATPVRGVVADAWFVLGGREGRVKVHSSVSTPMVFGLWKPSVLLPEDFESTLSFEEIKMVLAHEAAHIERRDVVYALYMFVVNTVFFFHPLVWLARHEWQLARESACDSLAIEATGASRRAYAAMLLKVSAGLQRQPALALGAVPTYRTLQKRIKQMKNTQDTRSGKVMWILLAVMVSAGAVPVVLVQRKPNFGAGVFETQGPAVKVTQQKKSDSEGVATAVLTPSKAADSYAPTGVAVQTTAPSSIATTGQAVPIASQDSGIAVVSGQAVPVTTSGGPAGPGSVAKVASGQAAMASSAPGGATAPALVSTGAPTVAETGSSAVAAQTTEAAYTGTAAVGAAPTSVTVVLRDRLNAGGKGLDSAITVSVKEQSVTEFLKKLATTTGVKIRVEGIASAMKLNAKIEGVRVSEVLDTIARIYGLDWYENADGSVTVRPDGN